MHKNYKRPSKSNIFLGVLNTNKTQGKVLKNIH